MERYLNLGGDSGVRLYASGDDSITVQFSDGSVYLYNYQRPGQAAVEKMKELAQAGRGLNSYINRFVGKRYAAKLR